MNRGVKSVKAGCLAIICTVIIVIGTTFPAYATVADTEVAADIVGSFEVEEESPETTESEAESDTAITTESESEEGANLETTAEPQAKKEEGSVAEEESLSEGDKESAGDSAVTESAETDGEETASAENVKMQTYSEETISGDDISLENADTLFGQYVERVFSVSSGSAGRRKSPRRNRLTGQNLIVYNKAASLISSIAGGTESSAVLTISASELLDGKTSYTLNELGLDSGATSDEAFDALMALIDVDYSAIVNALTADLPYDLYWFDKTEGVSLRHRVSAGESAGTYYFDDDYAVSFSFAVSADYSKDGSVGTYSLNTEKTSATSTSAANAETIVQEAHNECNSDFEVLTYFKKIICDLTSYNTAAAANDSTNYGDPWQLIYVFDGNEETKVVCEGYSKAFKYLCDLYKSSYGFEDTKLDVYTVAGIMAGGTGAGAHMWNVVQTQDGVYLADLTNSDEGTIGQDGSLFMVAGSGLTDYTVNSEGRTASYTVGEVTYSYDEKTLEQYEESEIGFSSEADSSEETKEEDEDVVDSGECGDNLTWKLTGTGNDLTLTISGSGKMTDYYSLDSRWGGNHTKIATVVVEEGVTSIGGFAFNNCSRLTSVTLPQGLTSIGFDAFNNCSRLTGIAIPEGVTSIGPSAFSSCTSLESVTIPQSVTDLGITGGTVHKTDKNGEDVVLIASDVFNNCSRVTDVKYAGTRAEWVELVDGLDTGLSEDVVVGCAGGIYVNRDGEFKDVTDESLFYYDAVYWGADGGLTTGWEDATFRPLNYCNRAAVVTFLWRLAGRPEPKDPSAKPFSDMTGNKDFDTAILWAVEQGITSGWSDGTFRPWNTCNRAAIVTFLWRYAGKPAASSSGTTSFSDMTGNSDFDSAIQWAAQKGITTGWSDGTFRPWNMCNRLAVMSFLYRYANL